MSEIPHNPEKAVNRYMSEETLTDVQGHIDRLVLEDPDRKDIGGAFLSVYQKTSDGIEEIVSIRWNKDKEDGKTDPTHAIVRLGRGIEGVAAEVDLYTIGITPGLCWQEFDFAANKSRIPVNELSAQDLIARLQSFIPRRAQ